jgi:hypothetical protein
VRYFFSAMAFAIVFASPILAADQLSGAWTTMGDSPAQIFIFKASGDRFAGVACGPCDRAASVFRIEDGRMDGDRVSFVVSYGAGGPRFKELGSYRDRVAGSIVNGRLSLTAQPEGRAAPASTLSLKRVVEGFVPNTANVPPSSLLTADPTTAPSSIDGRWVSPGRSAQQNLILKVRGQKVWGVICGPCTPDIVALVDDGTFDGTTLKFYINHIDTPPSPQQPGVRRNIMTGSVSGNIIRFKWVREGAETDPGGEMMFIGPIRD